MSNHILYLNREDIYNLISMQEAITATTECFRELHNGSFAMPSRQLINASKNNGLFLFMPAYLERLEASGIKIGSIYKNNKDVGLPLIHGIIVLFDTLNGKIKALLDGEAITELKTGSVSALATDILAPKTAKKLAIIGAGKQAKSQVEGVSLVRNLATISIYSKTLSSAIEFKQWLLHNPKYKKSTIVVCESAHDAVKSADIICTATSSDSASPIIKKEYLSSPVHINAIGGSTCEACEIDPQILGAASVVVDLKEAALLEAGEIKQAIKTKVIKENELLELGKLIDNQNTTKPSTIFKSVGLAAQDIVLAERVLQYALHDKFAKSINL